MNILLIGATRLIGTNTAEYAHDRGHEVVGTFHTESGESDEHSGRQLDKKNEDAVVELLTELEPDAIVDTATFHDVDACETERDRAWTVNA